MKASKNLRENVNALMRSRDWTSNKPIISASNGRLTNGTLGRIRGTGENTKLSQVEELAQVFGVEPHALLAPDLMPSIAAPTLQAAVARIAKTLAQDMPDDIRQDAADLLAKMALRHGAPRQQEELASLLVAVDGHITNRAEQRDFDQPETLPSPHHGDSVTGTGDENQSSPGGEWKQVKGSFGKKQGGSASATTKGRQPKPRQEKRK
jgi:hypothetical protein